MPLGLASVGSNDACVLVSMNTTLAPNIILLNGQESPSALKKPLTKSTPGRIRTCDLRIRSPLLYPAELRALAFSV